MKFVSAVSGASLGLLSVLSLSWPCSAFVPNGLSIISRRHQVIRQSADGAVCGIQFYPGVNEPCIPNIRLTRSRDGTSGVAYFDFEQPSMFDPKANQEDTIQEAITAMRMVDAEGEISSTDVSASFVNGQPSALSVTYIMQSSDEWDRFMRFMDNYAASNDLGFAGGGGGGGGDSSSSSGGGARSQAV